VTEHLGSLAEAIAQDTKLKKQRHADNSRLKVHQLALVTFNSLYAGMEMSLAERRAALGELQESYLAKTAPTVGVSADEDNRELAAAAKDGGDHAHAAAASSAGHQLRT